MIHESLPGELGTAKTSTDLSTTGNFPSDKAASTACSPSTTAGQKTC